MPFEIIRDDIARVRADAIVNSANPKPVCGSGTDTAIYLAAGEKDLLEARQQIGEIARGDAAATPAFALPAKIIIHTVGPIWQGGKQGELEVLASCYRKSLAIAEENGCESIAFPLISTGNYGFPKDAALRIALREISAFLENHEMVVKLVVFDRKAYELSKGLADDVRQYIDERYVESAHEREYAMRRREQELARREEFRKDASAYMPASDNAAMPPNAPFEAPQAHYSTAAPPPPPAAKKKPSFFS
ncbi:MAG: macro domain-containing protein, partial [Lachnospiraceae bacterium]|nr:macro domain-containing protein [Lachnospiraceae bacterium]